ncbi:hypothetical protein PPERSA_08431 [Pseudocohnilembus persalinus]|uniref:Transmembrane protein n=1 Tax=Pseudocohnilembus persalinus TaxID=266149 RepID=A0A0V0R6C6_PSEPJ|nr:hypothetical protein PPERSA_08431 [Pseudocohnilembus persalinus]|eukprot:KRX10028.1 hypothetical protein PPERSA_08431 [Pseudocohnilembus persalinus]
MENFFSNLDKKFVTWQLDEESDLFKIIHDKKLLQKEIIPEEQEYYDFYKLTYKLEITSFLLTFPVGFFAYKFQQERKKPYKNLKKVNFYLGVLAFVGLPAVHLYTWAAYRRFFQKQKQEDYLKQVNQNQLLNLKRRQNKYNAVKNINEQQNQEKNIKQGEKI